MMATELADQLPSVPGIQMRPILPHTRASFKIQVITREMTANLTARTPFPGCDSEIAPRLIPTQRKRDAADPTRDPRRGSGCLKTMP